MVTVNAPLQKRVTSIVQKSIEVLSKHYHVNMTMPTINYDLRGRTAGKAWSDKWKIELNAVLLNENVEDFLARTVPHEFAHLACSKIYPEAYNRDVNDEAEGIYRMLRIRGRRFRRPRRPKRDIHGYRWQEIMRVLGVKDISSCHTYDVTTVARKKASYQYKCTGPGCTAVLNMGPKKHAQLKRDPWYRWHRGCKGHQLVLTGHTAAKSAPAYQRGFLPNVVSAPKVAPPKRTRLKGITKQQLAYTLFQEMKSQYDRNGIIARFMSDLSMTQAGASTYYYNCQKRNNS